MSTEEKHWNGFGKKTGGAHVTIELMECENGVWRMDGALRGAALQEESTFAVEVNGVRTAYKVRREDTDEAKTVGSKNDGAGDMKFSFELPLCSSGGAQKSGFCR